MLASPPTGRAICLAQQTPVHLPSLLAIPGTRPCLLRGPASRGAEGREPFLLLPPAGRAGGSPCFPGPFPATVSPSLGPLLAVSPPWQSRLSQAGPPPSLALALWPRSLSWVALPLPNSPRASAASPAPTLPGSPLKLSRCWQGPLRFTKHRGIYTIRCSEAPQRGRGVLRLEPRGQASWPVCPDSALRPGTAPWEAGSCGSGGLGWGCLWGRGVQPLLLRKPSEGQEPLEPLWSPRPT